ncbi:hypothetical protein N0V93_006785 [Gnomoniopsis smithogilvyi]|uniref:Uncharacterized protein n=1 Tax=Gnomoniopsis smithogilvyi TaxID=1191159 RepID=A0A9W8YQH3_9PEZI|nr:hypothetical protein N0V93_006785 [Gnomoniopsis smithogilvyi]
MMVNSGGSSILAQEQTVDVGISDKRSKHKLDTSALCRNRPLPTQENPAVSKESAVAKEPDHCSNANIKKRPLEQIESAIEEESPGKKPKRIKLNMSKKSTPEKSTSKKSTSKKSTSKKSTSKKSTSKKSISKKSTSKKQRSKKQRSKSKSSSIAGTTQTESHEASPQSLESIEETGESGMEPAAPEKKSIRITLRVPSRKNPSSIADTSPAIYPDNAPDVQPRESSPQPLLSTNEAEQSALEDTESLTSSPLSTSSGSVSSENGQQSIERTMTEQTTPDAMILEEESPQKLAKTAMDGKGSGAINSRVAASIDVPEALKTNGPVTRRKTAQQNKAQKEKRQMEPRSGGNAASIEVPEASNKIHPITRKIKSQREKLEKEEREREMYTPNIDPSADPADDIPLPSPFELAKMVYTKCSCAYFEREVGETFPKMGPTPSKSLSVAWPENAAEEHTENMEAWLEKEQAWAKVGVPVRLRAPWSFKRAPKNIEELRTWLNRHGRSRNAASLPHLPDDRPLQRSNYVTEYAKMSKEVLELQYEFNKNRVALRTDANDVKTLLESLKEFAGVKDFKDEDTFDAEETNDGKPPHSESYIERMLRIKSHPPNDTIEYEDRIVVDHDGSIKVATNAMKRGDVSGASVPSERWHFNKDSRRDIPEYPTDDIAKEKEEENSKLAALALLELSSASNRAL